MSSRRSRRKPNTNSEEKEYLLKRQDSMPEEISDTAVSNGAHSHHNGTGLHVKSHDSGFTSMPTEVLAEPSSDAEFECEDEQGSSQQQQCPDETHKHGKNTWQYKRIFCNFVTLNDKLPDIITAEWLASELREKHLIGPDKYSDACVSTISDRKRIQPLIDAVMSQVELNTANYDKFISILKKKPSLRSIVELFEGGAATKLENPVDPPPPHENGGGAAAELANPVDPTHPHENGGPNNGAQASDERASPSYSNTSCCLCTCLFWLFFALLLATSFVFLIHFGPGHVPDTKKLGIQEDTIILSDFTSHGLTSLTVTECLEEDDDPQSLMVSLVKNRDIKKYGKNDTGTFNKTLPSAAARVDLLDEYGIYLLQESLLAVNICLSSSWESSVTVLAFVFNNSDNHQNFIDNKTDGIHSSLYNRHLQVGSSSQPICTWVNYSVAAPAYYYLALAKYTLGNLTYSYNWYLYEVYLNFTDYEDSKHYCRSVSESDPCMFKLKYLEQEKYILLAYIAFLDEPDSTSTHVCASFNTNHKIVIIPAAFGLIICAAICALYFVIIWNKCKTK